MLTLPLVAGALSVGYALILLVILLISAAVLLYFVFKE